ncbi:MAG: hypothetical protein PVI21_04955 [Candidatus Woesebacteria bacterium]
MFQNSKPQLIQLAQNTLDLADQATTKTETELPCNAISDLRPFLKQLLFIQT